MKHKATKSNDAVSVRIRFTGEVTMKGSSLADVKTQFEALQLFGTDAAEFVEVEDADTNEDLTSEFDNA